METSKEFHTIIFGHHITVYTEHQNLTYDNFTPEIALHWIFLFKYYIPTIKYIKCIDNEILDALINILFIKSDVTERNITRETLSERSCVNSLDRGPLPLIYPMIDKHQRKDK